VAIGFYAAAAVVGPKGECVQENFDAQVSSSRDAGLLLFVSALAMGGAAAFLAAGAIRGRSRPGNVVRGLTGLVSLGVACLTGFFALLEFVALQCLE
jgi:hypothetical protein